MTGTLISLLLAVFLATTDLPIEDPIWWLLNDEPPQVAVLGPSGPLRGQAEAVVRLQPAHRASIVSATLDGQPLPTSGTRLVVDSAGLPDGRHQVRIVARDHSRRQNEASAEWTFASDNSGPRLTVKLQPADGPTEGHTTVVRIRAAEAVDELTGSLQGRPLRLQPVADAEHAWWALVGIPPEPAYRSLELEVSAADTLGNETTWRQAYPLVRTKFPEEVLDFDPALNNLADHQVRALEMSKLMPVYRGENGPRRWNGRWKLPVDGPITTDFATRRSYNGRFPEGNHLGVDFATPLGAPVVAPADAVVAYAAHTPVRGNVLILDHGAGVYSTYAHLEQFEAEPGDAVKAGDVVALVGSTGLSTGPHLHWEVWVDSAAVDPLEWTKRTFP